MRETGGGVVFFSNHPVVLGPRFEETAPRVCSSSSSSSFLPSALVQAWQTADGRWGLAVEPPKSRPRLSENLPTTAGLASQAEVPPTTAAIGCASEVWGVRSK